MAGAVVAGLAVLTACSDGIGSSDDSGESSETGGSSERDLDTGYRGVAENAAVSGQDIETSVAVDDRKLIRTATIELESDDVDTLLRDLDGVVVLHRGVFDTKDVRTDDDGDAESASLVIRVPVDRFDATVDAIAQLGTLVREETSTEDVTTRVADVDARVASAQRSIAQLQELFGRAERLRDVIALESELARRQADLESLQAQQRSLSRQTTLSTIHVSVARGEVETEDEDRAGFVDGLESGWSGLVAFVRGTTHVVGLLLPLGALALIVAAPVWLLVRRHHLPSRSRPSE
jgi:Domain of unknown function (DUF4349)